MSWVEDCTSHMEHPPLPDGAVYYPEYFIANDIFIGEGREVTREMHKLLGTRFCHT